MSGKIPMPVDGDQIDHGFLNACSEVLNRELEKNKCSRLMIAHNDNEGYSMIGVCYVVTAEFAEFAEESMVAYLRELKPEFDHVIHKMTTVTDT